MRPLQSVVVSAAVAVALLGVRSTVSTIAPAAAGATDGAWADLGADGPAGLLGGARSGQALLVLDDATDSVWQFEDDAWTQLSAETGPPGVDGAAVAFAAGRLWAFGGRTDTGSVTGETWAWTAADGWVKVTTAGPPPRTSAAMAAEGPTLHLYGGEGATGPKDDLWRFDTAASTWTSVPCASSTCPPAVSGAALTVSGGALWLHGGTDADGAPTAVLHRGSYGGAWELLGTAPSTPPVSGHGLLATGDGLLAVGGCTAAGPVAWRYRPGSGWSQLHPAPMAQSAQGAAVVWDGVRAHAVGGTPCGAGVAATATHVALTPGAGDPVAARVERIGASADDPVALGLAVSRAVFSGQGARVAVLGTAARFPDSLAGAPLVWGPGGADGPLLYSAVDELSPGTAAELQRVLQPGSTTYLLGGQSALSTAVADAVEDLGFVAVRLSGPSRVETAAAVAAEVDRLRTLVGGTRTVLLADSRTFPDAIAAGGFAAAASPIPVLLTPGDADALHPAVVAALEAMAPERLVLLGGRAALGDGVAADAEDLAPTVERVFGAARDATAAAVATDLWVRTAPLQGAGYVAVGLYDPDLAWAAALAAAPLVATARAPVLALNPATPDVLPPGTRDYLEGLDHHPDRPGHAWIVGPAPDGAATALAAALG